MKVLKFDHNTAQLIATGTKTSTWRIYDDKDIAVNDVIEFIDKTDPQDQSTWRSIGSAQVDVVTEKRIADLSSADLATIGNFGSVEKFLQFARQHYGSQVEPNTPIKFLTFSPVKEKPTSTIPLIKQATLYADGGSRGNPGPSASGFAIMTMDGQLIVKKGIYLGVTTNNQAEYQALKLGLEEARALGVHEIHVYMDSLLVVNQMIGHFKIRNRDLWPIHDSIKQLASGFKTISFTHIPRELNKVADSAVNEALDAAAHYQTMQS